MVRITAVALAALLAGCASTTPTSEGMIPAFTVRGVRGPVHAEPVAIDVKDTKQIPGGAFRQALADAVTLSKVFSRVVDTPRGKYILAVTVTRLEQPESGGLKLNLNPTARMEAAWTLKRADTRQTVWQATIRSEHTAAPSDTLDARARVRLATEGAVRDNFALALARIAKLNLGSVGARAEGQPPGAPSPASFPYADPRIDAGTELRETALDPGGPGPNR
jgi:hypothetical protein